MIKNWFYKLFMKYILKKHSLGETEVIKDLADNKYVIEACYYDGNLNPIYIARTREGEMRSFPANSVEPVSEEVFSW